MTTTPNQPSSDPDAQPDERTAGEPSRPHGDPVMPDPDADPGSDSEAGPGAVADAPSDPEALAEGRS